MNLNALDSSNDVVNTYLDVPNVLTTLSTTAGAAASGVWLMVLNSTSAGLLPRVDCKGLLSNIGISAAFRMLANYFYGTGTYIIDANNGVTQNTTIKAIQFSRPYMNEGLYKGTITAVINAEAAGALTSIDVPDQNSEGSAFGLTGAMVDMWNPTSRWGTVFYDYGVIVFSNSQGTTGAIFSAGGASGFNWGATAINGIYLSSLAYKTRNILKRSIYFCRAKNKEFNYTFNPTARQSNGTVLQSLSANPTTYITTIGLYNDADELIALAKVSPAKKKSFNSEAVFRVQLDF